ncbi:MAG TPA: ABC transporter substrate-binding protein [Stellaceae bacterium]|nr:ABC transporter substrate-binding protein [Stellaceae bacterium]
MNRRACQLASAALLVVLGAAALPAAAQSDKVKIGFLTTLSGPGAELGQRHLEGFKLGLEMHGNKLGGKPVELITADDKLNPETGVEAVHKFIDSDHVNFVTGVVFSNVTMAVYKPVVDSKTLFVNSFSGPSPISGALCNPYFFGAGVQNDSTYEAVGAFVSKQPNIKSVFILAPNYQGGRDAVAGFKRYYKGKVLGEIYTGLNQPDYSAEIAQVRAAKPDALYFFYPGSMGITFVRQFADAHLGIPSYSGFSVEELTIHAIGRAANGAYSAAVYNDDLDNPANKRFAAAYEKEYKRRPSIYADLGYDAVTVLDRAVSAAKGNLHNTEAMRRGLKSAHFELARGPMRFNTNQMPIQNVYLVQAEANGGDIRMVYRSTIFTAHKDAYADKCPMR